MGTRLPFVILLADGTRAMRGQCEVIESYANPGNVYRRPGVKLALTELDEDSEAMLGRLQEARAIRDARTGTHSVSAAAVEVPAESRAALTPTASAGPHHGAVPPPAPPPPRPPAPPRPLAASKVPGLPPLPRLQGDRPGDGAVHAAGDAAGSQPRAKRPSEHIELPPRPSAVAIPPPPTDAADEGWDESRPNRAPTAPPHRAPTAPPTPPPPPRAATTPPADVTAGATGATSATSATSDAADEDSTPAMILAVAPDHAAAAVVAAAGDTMDAVPVVELINRANSGRRETGRDHLRAAAAPEAGSGRVERASSRHSSAMRATPGDVYAAEERTPGSSFILPANPLSNLTDESLQGFIDCTIYEDNSQAVSDPAISGSALGMVEEPDSNPDFRPQVPLDEPIAPPVVTATPVRRTASMAAIVEPARATAVERGTSSGVLDLPRPASQPLSSVDDDDDDDDDLLPPAVAAAPVIAPPAAAARTRTSRPTPPPPLPPPPRSASSSGSSAPDWMAPAASGARPRVGTKPPPKPSSGRWIVPVLFLAVVVGIAALYLRQRDRAGGTPRGGSGAVVARDASVGARDASGGTAPLGAPDAGVAGSTVDGGAATTVDAGARPAIDAGALASGTCHLKVSTTPAGAAITLGRRSLGPAPVDVDVDCGSATLTARMAKYQPLTRSVAFAAGAVTELRLKLARPNHNVTVVSTPRGATVTVDGRRAGTTPLSLEVSGFTRHSLTIELKGYQPYRTSVTTDDPEQTVAVPLVKLPE